MVLPIDEDLDIIFSTDDHGVAATWTPTGGDATTVNGYFMDQDMIINPHTGEIAFEGATFTCARADMSTAKQGDALVANSQAYTILTVPSSQSNKIIKFGLKINNS